MSQIQRSGQPQRKPRLSLPSSCKLFRVNECKRLIISLDTFWFPNSRHSRRHQCSQSRLKILMNSFTRHHNGSSTYERTALHWQCGDAPVSAHCLVSKTCLKSPAISLSLNSSVCEFELAIHRCTVKYYAQEEHIVRKYKTEHRWYHDQ